ncbi:MAG: metallophosphoesterase [Planctomycetes bacterium]|nr:metallophosphoesterase [Planctomycetota bacterium]
MARRIFVGDIQGCRVELERLLEKLAFDPARDELQPVGDLVNRGPDSLGALRVLRALGAGGVLGNHDVHLLRVAAGKRALREGDTIEGVLHAPDRGELLAWLASLPFVRKWDDVWLVHAALHPAWADPEAELRGLDPLELDARIDFATRARYTARDGTQAQTDPPPTGQPFRPWFEHWFDSRVGDKRTVVYGHWARMNLVLRSRLRGLDTGCVWGGKLSAWIAEEDRIVQVDAAQRYAEFND